MRDIATDFGELPDPASSTGEALAEVQAPLEEWDELAVRDHWDAVVASELGAPAWKVDDAELAEHGAAVVLELKPRRYRGKSNRGINGGAAA